VITTRGNTLLNHGEDILAGGGVSGIVSPFRRLSRGAVEGRDAKSGRFEVVEEILFRVGEIRVWE